MRIWGLRVRMWEIKEWNALRIYQKLKEEFRKRFVEGKVAIITQILLMK